MPTATCNALPCGAQPRGYLGRDLLDRLDSHSQRHRAPTNQYPRSHSRQHRHLYPLVAPLRFQSLRSPDFRLLVGEDPLAKPNFNSSIITPNIDGINEELRIAVDLVNVLYKPASASAYLTFWPVAGLIVSEHLEYTRAGQPVSGVRRHR